MIKRVSGSAFAGAALFLLVVLVNLRLIAFDAGFYQAEFARIGHSQQLGTNLDELNRFSTHMTRYLRGLEPDPNVRLVLYEEERWLLNDKEMQHMQDVRSLFFLSGRIVALMTVLIILLFAMAFYHRALRVFWIWSLRGAIAAMVLAGLMAVAATLDFTQAFTWFHLLVFSNDLWLLDPSTDALINLLPEQFFADAAALAFLRSVLSILGIAVVSWIVAKPEARIRIRT